MTEVYIEIPQTGGIKLKLGVVSSSMTIEEMIEGLISGMALVEKLMKMTQKK